MKFNLEKNNLDKSSSPYLKQHKENPVHWQEWRKEILDYAKNNNKIIFVSSGYSTCHWCHVMARDAFSDYETANYLNKYFVSIKVDREQRPDIDKWLMNFLVKNTGAGGWPLNVFLTPDLNPFFALTFASTKSFSELPSFLDILKNIKNYYHNHKNKIQKYEYESFSLYDINNDYIKILKNNFDYDYGGFGFNQKFPPYTTLIFLVHYYEETKNKEIKDIILKTLEIIIKGGLHDHLQGGFFRYCVDRKWEIPHFEKMLYDQAMLLWLYSIAYKIFKNENYKITSRKIIKSLYETFRKDNLYIVGHDAETDHEEGLTYLWDYKELKNVLDKKEFALLKEIYEFSENGNLEGKNHLIRNKLIFTKDISEIEEKLLTIRKKRKQPFKDEKIITSWNCLLGIAFINAYRYFENDEYFNISKKIFEEIIKKHYSNILVHSSIDNIKQEQEFLEDYSALFLFSTYLYEEDDIYKKYMIDFHKKLEKFKHNENWIDSKNKDFFKFNADYFDSPTPSSISLAELAISRNKIFSHKDYLNEDDFKTPLNHDFLNISILIKKGLFHVITSKDKLIWKNLPLNSIQIKGDKFTDCYKGKCSYQKL